MAKFIKKPTNIMSKQSYHMFMRNMYGTIKSAFDKWGQRMVFYELKNS